MANNKARKKELAEFMGLSLSAVDALAYNGRGELLIVDQRALVSL